MRSSCGVVTLRRVVQQLTGRALQDTGHCDEVPQPGQARSGLPLVDGGRIQPEPSGQLALAYTRSLPLHPDLVNRLTSFLFGLSFQFWCDMISMKLSHKKGIVMPIIMNTMEEYENECFLWATINEKINKAYSPNPWLFKIGYKMWQNTNDFTIIFRNFDDTRLMTVKAVYIDGRAQITLHEPRPHTPTRE